MEGPRVTPATSLQPKLFLSCIRGTANSDLYVLYPSVILATRSTPLIDTYDRVLKAVVPAHLLIIFSESFILNYGGMEKK